MKQFRRTRASSKKWDVLIRPQLRTKAGLVLRIAHDAARGDQLFDNVIVGKLYDHASFQRTLVRVVVIMSMLIFLFFDLVTKEKF